jgi:hypothetical protein
LVEIGRIQGSPITEQNQYEDTKELRERLPENVASFAPPELWLGLYDIVLWNVVVNSWTVLLVRFVFRVGGAPFGIEVFCVLIVRDGWTRGSGLNYLFFRHIMK